MGVARNNLTRARAVARRQAGFTMIEVLIAALVLSVGIATFFNALNISVHAQASTRAREGATNLAREILEDARTIPYAQLAPANLTSELQAMPGLASASAKTWTIQRRGYTYTVTASECAIDDPKDGYGAHDSTFCAESLEHAASSPADTQPADLKRITVDITWPAIGRSPAVHQVETLTAAGQTIGLAASALKVIRPTTLIHPEKPVITKQSILELEFLVTAPESTAAMDWTLEGVRQSPQPMLKAGSKTEWVFTWKIPYPEVSDGTYLIAAQAIDSTGVEGPPVSISVVLARGVPSAPKSVVAGFNTINEAGKANKVIELEWLANSERNVVGYRVYHLPGGSETAQLICPSSLVALSLALSCIDHNPPKTSSSNLTYEVVALYYKPNVGEELLTEEIGEGSGTQYKVASGEPTQPAAPSELSVTKNADGSVTLKWPKVAGAAFYRVYRGSTNYTSRYGVVAQPSGATAEFQDTGATTEHSYWVTTVNSTLTESPYLGPVTK